MKEQMKRNEWEYIKKLHTCLWEENENEGNDRKKNVRQNRRVDDENVIFYTICILSNLIFIFKFPKYYV